MPILHKLAPNLNVTIHLNLKAMTVLYSQIEVQNIGSIEFMKNAKNTVH